MLNIIPLVITLKGHHISNASFNIIYTSTKYDMLQNIVILYDNTEKIRRLFKHWQ